MGVSILMTPGPVGRNFGKQISITPGFRSRAAAVIRSSFGEAPLTLVATDLTLLDTLEAGASVYESDNIWKKIAEAVREHSAVTILMEY